MTIRMRGAMAVIGMCALHAPLHSALAEEYVVTVAWSGGDYQNPIRAAKQAFNGDRWCQATDFSTDSCRIDVSADVHVLWETLTLPEGVGMSGAGVGETTLLARPGVEIAVATGGRTNISDLSIVNRQAEGQITIGLETVDHLDARTHGRLDRVSIHASGPMQNIALSVGEHLVVTDSTLAAIGGTGTAGTFTQQEAFGLELVRSQVSAIGGSGGNTAISQHGGGYYPIELRIHDSHVRADGAAATAVNFDTEDSKIDIRNSVIEGTKHSLIAIDEFGEVHIVDSVVSGPAWFRFKELISLDGVTLHGTLRLEQAGPLHVLRSHIADETVAIEYVSTFSAESSGLQVRHSVLDSPTPVTAPGRGGATIHSSVLSGVLSSLPDDFVARCSKTFGPNGRLVNNLCQ